MTAENFHPLESLAKALRVSPDSLRTAIKSRELDAVNIGSTRRPRWRIAESAWQRYLDNRSTKNTAPPSVKTASRQNRPARTAAKSYI